MLGTAIAANAEGYQVNTFSAKQEGMGHAGVAMPLGAESQLFNPGALAFSDKTFEISGAVSAISAHATATYDGADYKTDNGISTPMNFSAAFRIFDNFYGGLTFYTPYGARTGPAPCSTSRSASNASPSSPPCRGVFCPTCRSARA